MVSLLFGNPQKNRARQALSVQTEKTEHLDAIISEIFGIQGSECAICTDVRSHFRESSQNIQKKTFFKWGEKATNIKPMQLAAVHFQYDNDREM